MGMVDIHVLVEGPSSRESGPKDLTNHHHSVLDQLGVPDFDELVLCGLCGTCYTHDHVAALREAAARCIDDDDSDPPIATCQFIPIPSGSSASRREPCGHALEMHTVKRPHGRDEVVMHPLKIVKVFDLGLWLFRFCSLQHSTSPLFHHITSRLDARDPLDDTLHDIWDGDRWSPFCSEFCSEPETTYMYWAMSFDFVSPFANDHRSSKQTKDKKIGLLHFILLNLPPALRNQALNVCTAAVLDQEPTHTINGITAFVVKSLQHLYSSGMSITTSDGKKKFIRALLYVVFADGPARSKCCGCPYPTGNWPCNECFGVGTQSVNPNAPDGRPLVNYSNMQTFPARTHAGVMEVLQEVELNATSKTALADATSTRARGYRWTPFLLLPYFDAVLSIAWDAMHVWVENVLVYFLTYFVQHYGQDLVDHCNKSLDSIKHGSGLPSELRNSLRSDLLDCLGTAKAHEVLTFVNTVSEHIFDTVFESNDRLFWKMLADVSRFISSYTPRKRDLAGHEALFRTAIVSFATNHPEAIHPPNVHFATHLFANIRRYGPSFTTWCFANERLMGRVGKLSFSSSRKGLLRTISRAFRTQMFTKTLLERARASLLADSGDMSREQQALIKEFLAKADHFLPHSSSGPWDIPSHVLDTIYAVGRQNHAVRSVGFASEDRDSPFQVVLSSRPSNQFKLPQVGCDYAPGTWESSLLEFLCDNNLIASAVPMARCFQRMSFRHMHSAVQRPDVQPKVCSLGAPCETWNLSSSLRSPNLWSDKHAINGSVIEAEFEVRASAAAGASRVVRNYYGQVLTFVEISFTDSADLLHLAYVKWRKFSRSVPSHMKSVDVVLVNSSSGRQPTSSHRNSPKWTSAQATVLTDECYETDPWLPINRIMGRVALLPCMSADGSRVMKYRVAQIPFA